jgi:hypothetical protein
VTLAEFALLVDAEPKWVLNARQVLGRAIRYTLPVAEQLAIARLLQGSLQIPLTASWELARRALAAGEEHGPTWLAITADETITLGIDVHRLRSAFHTRRSRLETTHVPRRVGRPARRPRSALRAAEEYGLDLSLLRANLHRSPAQRLRQLDGMVAFRKRVRRSGRA